MEELIRTKCTSNYDIIIPNHLLCRNIEFISTEELNEEINKDINDDNSVNTLVIPDEEIEPFINRNLNDNRNESNDNTYQSTNIPQEDIVAVIETNQREVINESINTNEANDLPELNEVVIERNKRRKNKSRNEFSFEMKDLQRRGLVNLNPKIINKDTGKAFDKGLYVTCNPCKLFRAKNDGNIHLRRAFYDYYYFIHTQNQAHLNSKILFDRKEKLKKKGDNTKEKTYTQSMISAFLVSKVNNNSNTTETTNNINESGSQPNTKTNPTNTATTIIDSTSAIVVDNAKPNK
jgi:hypothetical protein